MDNSKPNLELEHYAVAGKVADHGLFGCYPDFGSAQFHLRLPETRNLERQARDPVTIIRSDATYHDRVVTYGPRCASLRHRWRVVHHRTRGASLKQQEQAQSDTHLARPTIGEQRALRKRLGSAGVINPTFEQSAGQVPRLRAFLPGQGIRPERE